LMEDIEEIGPVVQGGMTVEDEDSSEAESPRPMLPKAAAAAKAAASAPKAPPTATDAKKVRSMFGESDEDDDEPTLPKPAGGAAPSSIAPVAALGKASAPQAMPKASGQRVREMTTLNSDDEDDVEDMLQQHLARVPAKATPPSRGSSTSSLARPQGGASALPGIAPKAKANAPFAHNEDGSDFSDSGFGEDEELPDLSS